MLYLRIEAVEPTASGASRRHDDDDVAHDQAVNEPLSPVTVKKRRKAMPSTGADHHGAWTSVAMASRPGKR